MIYGLAGASGTGKTTLGERVGSMSGIPFVKTSVTEMARECGYDAIGQLSLGQRLDLQEKMLARFEKKLNDFQGHVILDRTPLDMIGYMMAEVYMHSSSELTVEEMQRIDDYASRCAAVTSRFFDHVFITGILPKYEESATRPGYNPAYQRHVHLLILGAVVEHRGPLPYSLFLSTDLGARAEYMTDTIIKRIAEVEQKRKSSRHIH